jgi:hypothetical protein
MTRIAYFRDQLGAFAVAVPSRSIIFFSRLAQTVETMNITFRFMALVQQVAACVQASDPWSTDGFDVARTRPRTWFPARNPATRLIKTKAIPGPG